MKPPDLLDVAKTLASTGGRRPKEASLRRATSTAYYALFHALAACCADSIVGGAGSNRSAPAWRQVYRALDHGHAKNQCRNTSVLQHFPVAVQDFARTFADLQERRHSADYDPHFVITKSEAVNDIANAELAIQKLKSANLKDKRAFAAWVMFKQRR